MSESHQKWNILSTFRSLCPHVGHLNIKYIQLPLLIQGQSVSVQCMSIDSNHTLIYQECEWLQYNEPILNQLPKNWL